MFPSTPSAEMISLLTYVGFSASDAELAVDEIYGTHTEFVVSAQQEWQKHERGD